MAPQAEAMMEALILAAEDLLAEARRRGERIGLDAPASGIIVLQHAYAMALADCAGQGADVDEVESLIGQGVALLVPAVHLHLVGRGRA